MRETQETQVRYLGQEDPLEEGLATHSSIPAWRIPWTEEPGVYSPWGCKRVSRNWSDWTHTVISTAVSFHLILIYCNEVEISGCQKIKTCQKYAAVAKITPVPTLSTLGLSETAVMIWDQGLICTVLKVKVNNMKKIQIQKYPLTGRELMLYSVWRSTYTILSVGIQGEFWHSPRWQEPGGLQSLGLQRVRHNWGCTYAGGSESILKMG